MREQRRLPGVPLSRAFGSVPRVLLVVEDKYRLPCSLARYLAEAGFTVDQAADGVEGLQRMREATPDVVVLDFLVPRVSGRTFVDAFRRDPHLGAVPIILLSAAHDIVQAAYELQPRASLARPIDFDVLLAVINRVSRS